MRTQADTRALGAFIGNQISVMAQAVFEATCDHPVWVQNEQGQTVCNDCGRRLR